eukprot:4840512-Prymnesium_polylepis.1
MRARTASRQWPMLSSSSTSAEDLQPILVRVCAVEQHAVGSTRTGYTAQEKKQNKSSQSGDEKKQRGGAALPSGHLRMNDRLAVGAAERASLQIELSGA